MFSKQKYWNQMLLSNEVSVFSNSKNPSNRSVFEQFVLSLIVSESIFRKNFYIQRESFHFNTWKILPLKHALVSIVTNLEEFSVM